VVTPDVHLVMLVEVVQSVSSPQTASVSLTHQHELQRAMITNVDSDKVQSHRLKSSAETTGSSDNCITNLESAGALLQQERALIVSQSDVGSQLQQVCETQVPRRSTASSVDDGSLGGLQRLEIWTGKSQCYDTMTHAYALRTSDLDTGFFHTDMKVLVDHFHGQPTVLYCVPTNPGPRSFFAWPVRRCRRLRSTHALQLLSTRPL
jgi:hypothetical protein